MFTTASVTATFDHSTQTFRLDAIPAKIAHVLIWGGTEAEITGADEAIRSALIEAEDSQMTDAEYAAMVQL